MPLPLLPPLSMSIDLLTFPYYYIGNILGRRKKRKIGNHEEPIIPEVDHHSIDPSYSVSVLIPAYNEGSRLRSTIESIIRQTHNAQDIFVLDDHSTDNTKKICEDLSAKHGNVHHVINPIKLGKAGNINEVVNQRFHELSPNILVLDGDVEMESMCLEELINAKNDAAVVTGYGSTKKPSAFIPGLLYEGEQFINGVFSFRKKAQALRKGVFVVCGALSLYDKDVLKKVPIPKRTLTEDTDHTWVLQESGYKIAYSDKARARGGNPNDLKGYWKRYIRWFSGTFQNFYVHGRKELKKSKGLYYTTLLPGIVEVVPYSLTITALPIIAAYYPDIAKGIIAADFALSLPFFFMHPKGFMHAVKHIPDIYVFKYFGCVAATYAGIKTTWEKIRGREDSWINEWSSSSSFRFHTRRLTKSEFQRHYDNFMQLEENWTDLGEKAWTKKNFTQRMKKKWKLSSYVEIDSKVIGYAIVSKTGKGEAYLHKILVDKDYRGLGIGSALVKESLEKCRQYGLRELKFKSRLDNTNANGIYKKQGGRFTTIDRNCADGINRYQVVIDT